MKKLKLYIEDGQIYSKTKEEWLREMGDREYIHLKECNIERGKGTFFCMVFHLVFDEPCSRACKCYDPRNGKKGCCKHFRNTYSPGKEYILYKSGKIVPIKFAKLETNDYLCTTFLVVLVNSCVTRGVAGG
jgi:hypothetical protein